MKYPRYEIGPWIGVARVGNSDEFFLAPDGTGALPIEYDTERRAPKPDGAGWLRVRRFKDKQGRIRRQAAWFRIFRFDDETSRGVPADPSEFSSIRWTVHLANKKVCEATPYDDAAANARLILDAGCVAIDGQVAVVAPLDVVNGPWTARRDRAIEATADTIATLGEARTTREGGIVVLGGSGLVATFGEGALERTFDDVSDGPVTCELVVRGTNERHSLRAWCIVAPPKFAPEIENLVTLEDVMEDVAVRELGWRARAYTSRGYNPDYVANFDRDIRPLLDRPERYQWVAPVASVSATWPRGFDPTDASPQAEPMRRAVLGRYRQPLTADGKASPQVKQILAAAGPSAGLPLIPVNAADDEGGSGELHPLLSVTRTQYFLLEQWASGRFVVGPAPAESECLRLTRASVGNCVGGPLEPGFEVARSVREKRIYEQPFRIRHRAPSSYASGLSTKRDETRVRAGGCEPGDMTKRMPSPWQVDLGKCTSQNFEFTGSDVAAARSKAVIVAPPVPRASSLARLVLPTPRFEVFWWPAQLPYRVFRSGLSELGARQSLGEGTAEFQRSTRGDGEDWWLMGFVVNQASDAPATAFTYFTEQERTIRPEPDHGPASAAAPAPAAGTGAAADLASPDTGATRGRARRGVLAPTPRR